MVFDTLYIFSNMLPFQNLKDLIGRTYVKIIQKSIFTDKLKIAIHCRLKWESKF